MRNCYAAGFLSIFRNMDAQAAVLDLLAIPFEKKDDLRMMELMRLAHNFLQHFCRGNHYNQALLHKKLELFLNPGVSLAVGVTS